MEPMVCYIVLPPRSEQRRYSSYFSRVARLVKNAPSFPMVLVADQHPYFLQSTALLSYKQFESRVTVKDWVFDLRGMNQQAGDRYFNVSLTALDCVLYPSLLINNTPVESCSTLTFPVELLSSGWFDILRKPMSDEAINTLASSNITLSQCMSSKDRALIAQSLSSIKAANELSALEAILLGVTVDYPSRPAVADLRNYFLSTKLLPASVLTDEAVFMSFIHAGGIVDDSVLYQHHRSIEQQRAVNSPSLRARKLRKFKRDPFLFLVDALKKPFRLCQI